MPPQLRQDLLSNEWVCVAPDRLKRPHSVIKPNHRKKTPKNNCPFEDPEKSGNKVLVNTKEVFIIENKFPAFSLKNYCPITEKLGLYKISEAIGHHEILITKNHDKNISDLGVAKLFPIFKTIQNRIIFFKKDSCVKYVSIFQNWGERAGASIYHPHFQMFAIPIVPSIVSNLVNISENFYKKNKKCIHCHLIDWEIKQKNRIIFENKGAVAMIPFAAKEPFLVRVFPKKHISSFENTKESDLIYTIQALDFVLKHIKKNLKNPDYNLHIRTAPVNIPSGIEKNKNYHWYFEITTKFTIFAGFEENTGIEINPIDPIDATKIIKK